MYKELNSSSMVFRPEWDTGVFAILELNRDGKKKPKVKQFFFSTEK